MEHERGWPWEFDAGPTKTGGWPELFAATPNYRALGRAVVGREAFRWHFGPMFYRGRLDGSARVIVVGQEGAQDESLSHRSFTGGTGGHMQHFLSYLGLDRSYLFLNSFVYPIFGQYTADLRRLGQDTRSPVVAHRHRILDKAVGDSDARLVVAVGKAAKESVATWIRARGGTADPDSLHLASVGPPSAGLRFLGVRHPGGAAAGGLRDIKADFAVAAGRMAAWIQADPGWLPADATTVRNLDAAYRYRSTPVPHRDFPFGTSPLLGRGSTSSNRADSQRAIQLFSAGGRYNGAGASLQYTFTANGSPEGFAADQGDLPYEPPRAHPRQFDPGPSASMAQLLVGAQPGLGWPDFAALGVTSHPSFGVGAMYRGRFENVSVVVLVDPDGVDDVFCARAWCGEGGQRFQGFLTAAGLTSRYLILRTVPVDTSDLSVSTGAALVDRPETRALHQALLTKVLADNPAVATVLAVGPGARRLAPGVVPPAVPVIALAGWNEPEVLASWQQGLDQLRTLTYPKDSAQPSFLFDGARSQIPRADLPYGSQRWIGTSGDRASRPLDTATGRPSPNYLKLYLPTWVTKLAPAALSPAEQAAADQLTGPDSRP